MIRAYLAGEMTLEALCREVPVPALARRAAGHPAWYGGGRRGDR